MVKSRFNLYNPFDDMIMEDPAYAADAMDFQAVQPVAPLNVNVNAPYRAGQTYQEIISRPEVQEQIEQGSQTMADIARGPINFVGDVFAQTLGRIAENMVNEEAAQRGRERFSNQKEAAGMFGKLFSQLTPDEIQFYEQRTGKSTQRPSSLAEDFTENFNFTLDVLLRDAIDGSKAIQDGARFTELPGNQQLGIFLLPLEFWLGGGGARRAGQEIGESLVQKYKDMPLGELVVNPQAQQEIPEVIAQIQREYPILVTSRPRQLETTEDFSLKPQSDMDLSLSQMEAADQRSKRFLTGKSDDEYTTQQLAPERPKVEVKESLKKELEEPNLSNDKKIVKAVIEELDEGKKYADDAEFVKAIENKTGIKDLSVRKISLAKDKQVSQKRLKIPFTLRDPKVGIIGKYRPTQTDNFKKVVEDIEARKGTINAVKPGELTKIARDNDINVDRLREKFPELVVTGRPTRETLEASAVSRRQASLNKVNQMIAFKRQYALKNLLNPDEIPFEEIVQAMKAAGLKPLEGKKLKQYLKSGEITQQQFKNLIPRSQMFKETKPSTGDKIQDIIDGPGSEYQKATDIVTKFGFTVDSGNPVFAKYLANSARKDLPGFVEEMRRAGAMTADEFAQSDELATGLYKNRAEYNQTILDELLNSRMNDDLARGEEPNIPLFNFTENARQGAMNEVDAFLRKTFLEETNDKKLLKMRDAFLKEYGGTLKRKIDLSTQRGQDAFIRNLKKIFGPQLAHTAPVGGQLSSKVIADFADNIRINPAAYNVQLQVRVERGIQTHFRKLKKALKDGNKKEIKDLIKVLKNYDKVFKKRNIGGYYRIPEIAGTLDIEAVLKRNGFNAGDGELFLGKEKQLSPDNIVNEANIAVKQVKDYFEKAKKNPELIKFHKKELGRAGSAEEKKKRAGLTSPIRKGFPVFKFDKTDLFKKGGPVRMAIGGDVLTNLNQQQFSSDPAFEGENYFQQAVDSGNLYAFNPLKLFKLFGKVDGVQTPKKITEPEVVDAPPGTTLPATQVIQPQDFPFRSYTLEAIMDPNAPKAATPQAWADFLVKGKKSPVAELQDSGLEQYLRDFEAYFPNQKITQTQLIDYYETSPIGNLSFKVKEDAPVRLNQDSAYSQYSGNQKHKLAGNQPLDEIGSEYREIVVEAGPLPGETRPYVQSGHYSEPNVIGFTRVANYTGKDGNPIAVIQEMQTDMLTTVRKEQERLQALLGRIKNYKASAEQKLQSASEFDVAQGQDMLQRLNQKYPPTVIKALEENQNLIKPFPNEAGKELIPGFAQDIQNLQKQIDAAVKADIAQTNPETGFLLTQINNQQMEVLNKLQDLNRSGEIDQILGGIKIPSTSSTDDLTRIANDANPSYLEDGFTYGTKDLTLFPPIPFNKQPDYVDLLIKATIKDAQSKGINKVAIYPADLVNRRWNKTPGSAEGKKFEDLYGKVAIQQMKNIAKKYGGTAQFEAIIDPTKATKGLRYYNRNIDGNKFDILKEEVPRAELSPEEVQPFFDEQIKRMIDGQGSDFRVALTREVAPGQTMDYYVLPADNDKGFLLQPFKEGDALEDAQIIIEEFNPQEIKMFTVTLDSPKAEQPMYLFKKKSGGSIDKDSLVSITDIYGEYGR